MYVYCVEAKQDLIFFRDKGPNHLFHSRQISIKTKIEILHLAGVPYLMKLFLEGSAPLRFRQIHITEHFLGGNVPLIHL